MGVAFSVDMFNFDKEPGCCDSFLSRGVPCVQNDVEIPLECYITGSRSLWFDSLMCLFICVLPGAK